MGLLVVNGAQLMCSFGVAPSALTVLPQKGVLCGSPAATIMDMAPMTNIMPFGMCNSLANPTVASATAAAMGVLTPMPCVPAVVGPWAPGVPTLAIGGVPALDNLSKATCAYGGMIQVVYPGQAKTAVG